MSSWHKTHQYTQCWHNSWLLKASACTWPTESWDCRSWWPRTAFMGMEPGSPPRSLGVPTGTSQLMRPSSLLLPGDKGKTSVWCTACVLWPFALLPKSQHTNSWSHLPVRKLLGAWCLTPGVCMWVPYSLASVLACPPGRLSAVGTLTTYSSALGEQPENWNKSLALISATQSLKRTHWDEALFQLR